MPSRKRSDESADAAEEPTVVADPGATEATAPVGETPAEAAPADAVEQAADAVEAAADAAERAADADTDGVDQKVWDDIAPGGAASTPDQAERSGEPKSSGAAKNTGAAKGSGAARESGSRFGRAREKAGAAASDAKELAAKATADARERAAGADVEGFARSTTSLIDTARPFFLAGCAAIFAILAFLEGHEWTASIFAVGSILCVGGAAFSAEFNALLHARALRQQPPRQD